MIEPVQRSSELSDLAEMKVDFDANLFTSPPPRDPTRNGLRDFLAQTRTVGGGRPFVFLLDDVFVCV